MAESKILIAAYLQSIGTRADGGERLTFVTDRMNNEQILVVRDLHKNSYGFLLFKGAGISEEEENMIDTIDMDLQNKPLSQRLRSVLYRNWEQKNKGYEKFKDYYEYEMNKLLTHYKNKLDQL